MRQIVGIASQPRTEPVDYVEAMRNAFVHECCNKL